MRFWPKQLSSQFFRNVASMSLAQIPIRVTRLATTLLLTRFLGPAEFGLAAVVMTTYEIVGVLSSNGFLARIVQATDDADADELAETAYWLSWLVFAGMSVIQCSAAVALSAYYHNDNLFWAVAGISLVYLATPLTFVQCAFLQREGRLGVLAFGTAMQIATDNVLSGIFAVSGLGMWAIVLPKILVTPIWVFKVRASHSWRPKQPFTIKRWRDFYNFGRFYLPVEALTAFRGNIDNFLIGSMLGLEALGIYYFAFNAGLGLSLGVINAAGDSVYPHLCAARGDKAELRSRFIQGLKTLSYIAIPVIALQSLMVPVYVPLVFGAKWTSAVPVVVLICLSALTRPLALVGSQLLKAINRPDLDLYWNIGFTALLTIGIFIGAMSSVVGVAVAVMLVNLIVLPLFCLAVAHWQFGATQRTAFATSSAV